MAHREATRTLDWLAGCGVRRRRGSKRQRSAPASSQTRSPSKPGHVELSALCCSSQTLTSPFDGCLQLYSKMSQGPSH
ncbi:hypothetical protein PsYK624_135090 [Phanerochaete sordida]|uniref:Uncharacterized protein n=1 Tax=Phanerochaete sordida TaxID=48140 RepID=A0A9P3GJZ2_9APHY|nr:hypothetical protein PsYK624_135090 [Phanerochaete sordida]